MKPNMDNVHYVYFVKCGEAIKIGVAENIERRIKEFKVGNPFEITLEFAVCFEDRNKAFAYEKELHYYFDNVRIKGEWFEAVWVESYIAGLTGLNHSQWNHRPYRTIEEQQILDRRNAELLEELLYRERNKA